MCWYCGSPITDADPLGRSLRCAVCGRDLRVCRHCRFYLPGFGKDCAESAAEPPADKERGNFCDWFSLNPCFREPSQGEGKNRAPAESVKAAAAKAAFDNLFQ